MFFSMLITVHPLGGDLVRTVGRLTLQASVSMLSGAYPAGDIHELAELAKTFRMGGVA